MDRKELDALLGAKKKALKGLDLSGIDMLKPKPVDLSKTMIDTCTLSDLDFTGVSFAGATIKNTWTNGCNFSECDFRGTKFKELINVRLARAKFGGSDLSGRELSSCDLQGADFTGANLQRTNFTFADLRGACFKDALLTRAIFVRAKLAGADFNGATVDGVDWEHADPGAALNLAAGGEAAPDENEYATASTEGTPLIAVPASLAAQWTTADTERAMDAKALLTVAGWVETSFVKVGKGHALVLAGETDTGFVPIEGGGVLVRGGDFEDMPSAKKAVAKAIKKKKGWNPFPQPIDIGEGGLYVFDSASNGAAKLGDIECENGPVGAPLPAGSYGVDILGTEADSGPVVFIRLKRS